MRQERPKILILGEGQAGEHPLAGLWGDLAQADVVQTPEQAAQALGTGDYQGVFVAAGDYLPHGQTAADDQAGLILGTLGAGACIVDAEGRCTWSNPKMQAYSSEVGGQVHRICQQAHRLFSAAQTSPGLGAGRPGSKKYTFAVEDQYFEMLCSPVASEQGEVAQVVAVVWNATSGKRLKSKIDAIDASGRELAKLDSDAVSKLTPPERLRLLQEKIIRYSKDLMRFDHFTIRLRDPKSSKLEVVIAEGLPPEALEIDLYAQAEGNGISGYVAAVGRSYICHDTEKDPRYVLGLEHSKSSLTVPLMLFDEVVGIYNVESEQTGSFTEDDRQFAEIFGRYVALAMNILNLLVVERYTTSGQITDSVIHEMAQPLNDILHACSQLTETNLGDESVARCVGQITGDVSKIREALDNVRQGPNAVIGSQDVGEQQGDPILLGKSVLVADDEPNIRATIERILTHHGGEVTVAKDGYEACTHLERQVFDLVVSDIKMPYRNGYEIYAAAQRASRQTPVILMTGFGYDPQHSVVRASQEGLAAVLFKPFKVEQFLSEVRQAMEASESAGTPQ